MKEEQPENPAFGMYAFYLTDPKPNSVSFVDLNGFVKSHIKDEADDKIVWLKAKESFYWTSAC